MQGATIARGPRCRLIRTSLQLCKHAGDGLVCLGVEPDRGDPLDAFATCLAMQEMLVERFLANAGWAELCEQETEKLRDELYGSGNAADVWPDGSTSWRRMPHSSWPPGRWPRRPPPSPDTGPDSERPQSAHPRKSGDLAVLNHR
jgi:hypothetical protein